MKEPGPIPSRAGILDRRFDLAANGTSVQTELLAGTTTFLSMAYIIFVQPTVLGAAGMDFGSVLVATCLASAIASVLMALLANYPIALAPGMGQNFFFTYAVVLGMGVPWEVALGAVGLAGAIFVLTAFVGLRERLIRIIPSGLKHAVGAGIGLLIAFIGLQWSGLVVTAPGTLVGLGVLGSPATLLALFGLVVTAVLVARRSRAALLIGMLLTTLVGAGLGLLRFEGVVSLPPSLAPTFLAFDLTGALQPAMAATIFVFFFVDLFDTVGTLVGVGEQAGLMVDGSLPRARRAFLADAVGTVVGAALGTSTVTSYVESATGVSAGGRTGLTSLTTGLWFLLALLFFPLIRTVAGGIPAGEGPPLYPVIAPALILVGTMMMRSVLRIDWTDPTESIPAFLTIFMMPLAVSITEGIAFGFIGFSVLKAGSGRWREAHWVVHLLAALFLLRYLVLP